MSGQKADMVTNRSAYTADNESFIFDNLHLDNDDHETLEAQKLLAKRQRRAGKVEDIEIDIDELIKSKKRFKPTDDSTTGADGDSIVTPFVWPECDASLNCSSDDGFYLNKLACKCFATEHCKENTCIEGVEDLSPLEYCGCMGYEEIKALYPVGASFEAVQKSIDEGIAEAKASKASGLNSDAVVVDTDNNDATTGGDNATKPEDEI